MLCCRVDNFMIRKAAIFNTDKNRIFDWISSQNDLLMRNIINQSVEANIVTP